MRAPLSWLAEHVDLPAGTTPRQVADALIRVGLEVEGVESGAEGLSGPLAVGRVLDFADEPQKNGKVIRWCTVDVGDHNTGGPAGAPRGIVCGAHNFAAGDLVVVALPGSVLPGDFAISARKTYGHISDGMICSVRELGIGDEHDGILVLPPESAQPGADPLPLLGLDDAVLDVAVTTDRGYCLSIRGLAREVAAALDTAFTDVAPAAPVLPADGRAYEVRIDDRTGCDVFSVRTVTGLDPAAPTPEHIVRRLRQCGVRSISLAVDVTNYVMLETGQPLHAFDRARLHGPLHARRAIAGERLITLDGVERALDPDDMVVADDSGAVALAGVMGGASTEIGPQTSDVVLEAAHWDPGAVSRAVRRHRLPSEAARRFERDVDPEVAAVALARCVDLLVEHGGARAGDGFTVTGTPSPRPRIALAVTRPELTAGMPIDRAEVLRRLAAVGCTVVAGGEAAPVLQVEPPSWRPDLLIPADLVEEVVRLAGYDRLPSVLPTARPGTGLTPQQAQLRAVATALADAGYTEVLSFPFVATALREQLQLPGPAARLVNPLSEDEPELRTSLLPGLLTTATRNLGRGTRDLAIFETGLVFLPVGDAPAAPVPGTDRRPSADELAALDAALPAQPRHLAAVLYGDAEPAGWWGPGRRGDWADAVELARVVGRAARAELSVRAAHQPPWHPGRCAALLLGDVVVGHAGELHPRVVAALGLPERACAVELDLTALPPAGRPAAPVISAFPPVLLDVALVVPADVPAADVERSLLAAAGPLIESVRLFDVYADAERIGAGVRSLAFALRFRAPDRTLTVEEATAARDAAVVAAGEQFGARLRS